MIIFFVAVLCAWTRGERTESAERTRCSPFDDQPAERSNTTERLRLLREEMRRAHSVQGAPLEAYLLTTYDPHLSEFPADRDRRLEFLSGFTGSWALAAVTSSGKAALWTSHDLFTQANLELGCDWILFNESKRATDWLGGEVQSGTRVGGDARIFPAALWERLVKELNERSIFLVDVKNNLVDLIWYSRPNYTFHEALPLIYENSGDSWFSKVTAVRAELKREGCDALVVGALDEIAWLLNLRGRDLPYSPLLRAYLILSQDQIHLYTDRGKVGEKLRTRLRVEGCYTTKCVRLHGYEIIWEDLKTLSQTWESFCIPTETPLSPGVSRAVFEAVPVIKRKPIVSPIMRLKAEKNPREREGMHKAHLEDGVAIAFSMAHIQNKVKAGERVDELSVAELTDSARRERMENEGLSCPTTAAFGHHAAMPRFVPRNHTALEVNKTALLLVASGGQYLGGTTEVTRTYHLGKPTDEEREAYTRVLMSLVDLAGMVFPSSTTAGQLDVVARAPLWAAGKDYPHPTGHGIGSFLSLREGPILISSTNNDDNYSLKEGYFISIEPGYYKENAFGIRLGSVLEVVNMNDSIEEGDYLGFNMVTLVPFESKLIDVKMLSPQQVKWLNKYNSRVRTKLGGELKKHALMSAFYWLLDRVTVIPERGSSSASRLYLSSPVSLCLLVLLLATLSQRLRF